MRKNQKPEPVAKKKSHVRDFTNEEDVKEASQAVQDSSLILKVNTDEKTPLYFLRSTFMEGFAHWITVVSGDKVRVPCCGGYENKRWVSNGCPICEYLDTLLEGIQSCSPRDAKAKRQEFNDTKANFEVYFVVAKGEFTVVKTDGKTMRTRVDFDNPTVGLIRLSRAQFNTLKNLSLKYNFIQTNKDLFNRYIIADKQVRGEDDYASMEFIPAQKPTPRPDVDIPDECDPEEQFAYDEENSRRILSLHLNEEADDDDIDYENDEEEEAMAVPRGRGKVKAGKPASKPKARGRAVSQDDDDDDLDGVGYDDNLEEELDDDLEEESSGFDDGFLDDIDEEFEDDYPELEEDEPALPKRGSKKPASKPEPVRGRKPAPAKAVAKPEPVRGKKATAPARGRKAPEPEPAPVRGRKASKPAPVAEKRAPARPEARKKAEVVSWSPESPKAASRGRGRPAKAVPAGRSKKKMDM